jgi:AcrR family transcriptional regulator
MHVTAQSPPPTPDGVDQAARPLRGRLVDATLELLAEKGLESITLRAIARRAGVSHGAPLRHFESLADLLAEVAAHGFRLLERSLQEAAELAPPGVGPLARLRAAGVAYVRTAVAHDALFGLMFRPDTIDVGNARFRVDSAAAFDRLLTYVRGVQDAGWRPESPTRLLAGVVWAQVHGVATLWASGAFLGPVPDADLDETISLTLDLAFASGPRPENRAAGQAEDTDEPRAATPTAPSNRTHEKDALAR